jgi:hypothetical protein
MNERAKELSDRITQYLVMGGMFNPELANHEAVRDLLIECRKVLDDLYPHPNGIWVLYEDYERLKAENEALRRDAELGRWIREETPPIEEIAARVDGMEETE